VEYMEKGTPIKGAYYVKLLEIVCVAINEKRHGLFARGQRLQQNNSPSRNSHIAVASDRMCGFEILFHPLQSPGPTTCNYKPFGNLKNTIRGRRFASNNEQIWAC
ncbi:hypothetical protein CAPTEDRAFT_97020, partial [Capitella teleta]